MFLEDTGTKNHLSNAKLYFCQKGASKHMGKTSTKPGGLSVPPYIPDMNNLPLDLDWSRSRVHNLLN
jgi:hypothetical protein